MVAPLVGKVRVALVVVSFPMLTRLCEPGVVPTQRKYPLTPEPAVQLNVVDAEVSVLPGVGEIIVAGTAGFTVNCTVCVIVA